MATFIRSHHPGDFFHIILELERRPLEVNKYRVSAGEGRSQTFGFSRRMSYRPYITRMTWKRIELYKLLLDFAEFHNIRGWDAIQVNQNYTTTPHRDAGNQGESYIVGFGDYTGGELMVYDEKIDIHHKGYSFNGAELLHSTCPFVGTRYSIVFFRIVIPDKFPHFTCKASVLVEDDNLLLNITDSYDGSEIIVNKKGEIVRTVVPGIEMEWKGFLTSLKAK